MEAFNEETEKLKKEAEVNNGKSPKIGTIFLDSEPRSSPFYRKNPACEYDCSFVMEEKQRPENAVREESMKEYRERVNIDNFLLEEIVIKKRNPYMARNVVNTRVILVKGGSRSK